MVTKKWAKILYREQGVPDNYVDDSFLDELKKNLHTRTYEYWNVVYETGVVTQQLSSVCMFVVAYIFMFTGRLSPSSLLCVSGWLTLCGYPVFRWLERSDDKVKVQRSALDDLRSSCIFLTFSFGMSPILKTLTDSISTDTIYAMTVFMLLGNLIFYDYGTTKVVASQHLSLNASIFASVCLASRLPTTLHAFATVILAMQLFALWPTLRKRLKKEVPWTHSIMTWVSAGVAFIALYSVTVVPAIAFGLAHLFITYICPLWLIRLQPYKNNIHGPWDEAIIQH
ncbi:phosphatidylinositol N-acetylglucosaminyltransferase subunit C [Strongylocentrotus purpuratus]|uniref:Phosphatidylinositol N-acetylglucosaminyltransferase subunit C n=1 Tax=Strongylocentrotus purpuratus TaxID=7668 RepID=A0A7M7PLL9_STRPU|nr:phosphatidylinositol N-acetylglucosaminyltransferase subunit C-like [Strongylocentrotus purpuratus]XP_030853720.1 phosphatidylinositol N-acetylglucosaminyltransferase subunit C [Strongylocentrotus purpuratus]|eukprot:XP_792701.3 PREDICTED: phosphatidylinositol N-acetylglucosaminyltransferase subunit C [Strongylocentrotus purpuratus]